jgi:hypothetical protein
MYAGLLWCDCVILVFIADLRAGHERCVVLDHGDEHVGQQHRARRQVDGNGERQGCLAHRCTSEWLSPTQQFVVDLGDLLQELANPGVVGQTLADLGVLGLGDVVHLRRPAWVAHGQVVLGPMAGAIGALAIWIAAALVALDQGTPKDSVQWWQLAQQLPAASLEV